MEGLIQVDVQVKVTCIMYSSGVILYSKSSVVTSNAVKVHLIFSICRPRWSYHHAPNPLPLCVTDKIVVHIPIGWTHMYRSRKEAVASCNWEKNQCIQVPTMHISHSTLIICIIWMFTYIILDSFCGVIIYFYKLLSGVCS